MSNISNVPLAMYSRSFSGLSRSAQVLEFYLRHNESRATEGLFRLRIPMVMDGLGMEREEVEGAIEELDTARRPFIFDRDHEFVLDLDALRYNPIRNGVAKVSGESAPDKRIPGALRRLGLLPPEARPMIRQLLANAERYSPDFAAAIRDEFDDLDELDRDTPRPDIEDAPPCPSMPLLPPGGPIRGGVGDGDGSGDGSGEGDGVWSLEEETPGTPARSILKHLEGLRS